MKNIPARVFPALLVVALSWIFIQPLQAQRPKTTSTKASTTTITADPTPPPFCDEIVPKVSEQLQLAAEKSCETQTTCVLCIERSANAPVYMTMYAQPSNPKCRKVTDIAVAAKPPQQTLDLPFEILQSICTREGISLMLSFPDARFQANKYTYNWEVDGKRAGSGTDLNCICGKEATVTIYEKGSKRSITKTMKLDSGCNTSKN
ncbi:MAG: hypothetical protein EP344_00920 [Bacteroidetes bacterium]|nr:MAG: hypothetical protein EP344_00920 [Bacteroidota bacterium]